MTLKIVYMGTPDFAVPALKALVENRHDVCLVVTQPDRKKGRGRKLLPPPVKVMAKSLGIETAQPESVKDPAFIEKLKMTRPDYFIVAAFGHILSQEILDIPKSGAINIHASLLPKYRGAAPIQRAVMEGEKETGITTMLMDKGMDTGDILMINKTPVHPDDTAADIHDRLSAIGADLIISTLEGLLNKTVTPVPQDHSKATYAPMLSKKEGRINWTLSAKAIESFIRGVTPWPGAYTQCGDKRLKIFKARVIDKDTDMPPGTILNCSPGELHVAAGEKTLSIMEIQGASGKRLPVDCFLCGCALPDGDVLT